MSELIDNSKNRKELLKHLILQIHQGSAPQEVKSRLRSLLGQVPYDQVLEGKPTSSELALSAVPCESQSCLGVRQY